MQFQSLLPRSPVCRALPIQLSPFALAIRPCILPAAIGAAGANASQRFIEFFTANIRNSHTPAARARAMRDFLDPKSGGWSFGSTATL